MRMSQGAGTMRDNAWEVPEAERPSRRSRLRVATLLACVALVAAVGLITAGLIREPPREEVAPIELAQPAATATPTPTTFAPPAVGDDEDDPFDDRDDDGD